ncbi:NAD(P)-binding domain-containing protein [Saccharopolyspora tripterygii]
MHSQTADHRASSAPSHDVAVIGCGLMGAALARNLADHRRTVAVWNRTPERALTLAAPGVTPVESIQDAVRAAPLVIVCTTTYEAALGALAPVDDWHGRTLVNVSSGSPREAEEMAQWAAARGAAYLDGALFCYPYEVGRQTTMVAYSGPAEVWSRHEETLLLFGGASVHFSNAIATANQLLLGLGGWLVAAMSAYLETVDYLFTESVPASAVRITTERMMSLLAYATEEMATAIDTADFTTDQATIATFAQGARDGVATMRSEGHQGTHLAQAAKMLDAAEQAGLGDLGFGALVRLLRRPT